MQENVIRKLKYFAELGEKLKASRFIKETKNLSLNLKYMVEEGGSANLEGVDEDLLKSVLLDFRKIYMQGEEINFYSVCNLIELNSRDEKIKDNTRRCRKKFTEVLENAFFPLIINGQIEKPKLILDKWFNGNYFHSNLELKKQLENLGFGQAIHKFLFISTIHTLIIISVILSNNINLLLQTEFK